MNTKLIVALLACSTLVPTIASADEGGRRNRGENAQRADTPRPNRDAGGRQNADRGNGRQQADRGGNGGNGGGRGSQGAGNPFGSGGLFGALASAGRRRGENGGANGGDRARGGGGHGDGGGGNGGGGNGGGGKGGGTDIFGALGIKIPVNIGSGGGRSRGPAVRANGGAAVRGGGAVYAGGGRAGGWAGGGWRQDPRYDWVGARARNAAAFRLPHYYAPAGYGYGYRPYAVGWQLDAPLFAQDYWLDDPYAYSLPAYDVPYRWVRYYGDALLIDVRTGEVVDVVNEIFW